MVSHALFKYVCHQTALTRVMFTGSIRNFQFLLFTLMFQETYNTVLWAARDAILQWSHLETPAFLAKSTDQDVTITNIQHLGIQTIQAFSFDFKSMQSLYTIRNCFVNCLILFGIPLVCGTPFTLIYLRTHQK